MGKLPNHARTIFGKLREVPDRDRETEIRRLCRQDQPLESAVRSLLAAFDQSDSVLEYPMGDESLADRSLGLRPGDQCGSYHLLDRLGDGGFGRVFAAKQLGPVSHKVALKVLKPGMDSEQVLARFETERQALAMLDHPNIARFFDAGATKSNQPYFSMELVNGESLFKYCTHNCLSVERRVALLIDVCHAVQHAHQKGIIHRDLKPSNVLVEHRDGNALPKVIDFGVAKALDNCLSLFAAHTRQSEVVGTPLYMSPEQARLSRDVDTRTDVYSLGVMLYELLTGTTPIPRETCDSLSSEEIRQRIVEVDPPLPSRRLADADIDQSSKQFGMPHRKIVHTVRGDLDRIVAKALSKERHRRYASPRDLALDLERWRANKPVEARAPSTVYLVQRFVQRNLAACIAAAAIILSLAATTIFSVNQARIALAARNSEKLSKEHIVKVFRALMPSEYGQYASTLDMIRQSVNLIEEAPTTDQPFYNTLYGELCLANGYHEEALPFLQKANGLYEARQQENSRDGLNSRVLLALAYRRNHQHFEAEQVSSQVVENARELGPDGQNFLFEALVQLSVVKSLNEDMGAALSHAEEALTVAGELGPKFEITALKRLADCRKYEAKHAAMEHAKEALQLIDSAYEQGSFDAFRERLWVSRIAVGAGEHELAIDLLESELPKQRAKLHDAHYLTVKSLTYLALGYSGLSSQQPECKEKALARINEAMQIAEAPDFTYPDAYRECLSAMSTIHKRLKVRDHAQALERAEKKLDISTNQFGPDDRRTQEDRVAVARAHLATNNLQKARPLLMAAWEVRHRTNPNSRSAAESAEALISALAELNEYDEARRVLEIAKNSDSATSRLDFLDVRVRLATDDQFQESEIETIANKLNSKSKREFLTYVARTFETPLNRHDKAEEYYRRALEAGDDDSLELRLVICRSRVVQISSIGNALSFPFGKAISSRNVGLDSANPHRAELDSIVRELEEIYRAIPAPPVADLVAQAHSLLGSNEEALAWKQKH